MRMSGIMRLSMGIVIIVALAACGIPVPFSLPGSSPQGPPVTAKAPSTRPSEPAAGTQPTTAPPEPEPGSLAYLDAHNGFRDLTFGEPPTPRMVLTNEVGAKQYYTRLDEDLSLGDAQLEQLIYGFYKERLQTVILQTKGAANSRACLEALQHLYGLGAQPDPSRLRYTWRGSQVSVSYQEDGRTHDAEIWFHSLPLRDEERADQQAPAKSPKGPSQGTARDSRRGAP
jgi:hypothetical protein